MDKAEHTNKEYTDKEYTSKGDHKYDERWRIYWWRRRIWSSCTSSSAGPSAAFEHFFEKWLKIYKKSFVNLEKYIKKFREIHTDEDAAPGFAAPPLGLQ